MRSRAAAVAALAAVVLATGGTAAAEPKVAGLIRVDQVGFASGEEKHAYLMTTAPAPGVAFTVVDGRGRTVLTGHAGGDRGKWNDRYRHVYDLDLTALRDPGGYTIRSGGRTSPPFRIGTGFGGTAGKAVTFFQSQRDGAHVIPGELKRRAGHLGDRRATVYEWPTFAGPDTDEFDSVPHAFGLAATSRLYRSLTGDRSYDAFGTQQRNWVFGANPWGVSFMVGAGKNFVRCPHHQIANVNGRRNGR